MRRTLIMLISTTLLAAACGSTDAAPTPTETESVTTDDGSVDTDDGSVDTEPAANVPETTPAPTAPRETNPDKPTEIDVPGSAPTDLVVTVLTDGDGPEAELGDTVIVDYIGVRSVDGVEFDNSYDRFTPFSVGPLGSAPVIQGWNDGLIEAQAGARLQLDIPSDLAYGEGARSEIIRENEALTFIIDVRSVIKVPDPADAPTESGVPSSNGATAVSFEDLVEGEGAELEVGQTAVINLVVFRADNGEEVDSTWTSEPIQIPIVDGSFPGLVIGMPGMNVGGRRAIMIPPEFGFGEEGSPQMGLPAATDIVIVVDLLGAY